MGTYVIVLCIVAVVAIAVSVLIWLNKKKFKENSQQKETRVFDLAPHDEDPISSKNSFELSVRFEDLPALTETQEAQLVEIKDNKLLARIDNAVPGTLQAVANAGAIKNYNDAAKAAGQLYQAVIPKGAVLDKSRAMEGAFRGSFRNVPDSIKGNANWVPVDGSAANGLAAMNVANAAMGVASMVVGQYYMTQINDQLEGINDGIVKIADFQNNEYKSKVYALVAEVQKCATFHVETVVLLSQQKPSDRIEVDLDLDELDVTSVEVKATYSEIKDYVLKEHGLKVTNLYISQIKRKCGLEVGENYNLAKSEDAKQPNCPEEKEKAIVDALKHFGMI